MYHCLRTYFWIWSVNLFWSFNGMPLGYFTLWSDFINISGCGCSHGVTEDYNHNLHSITTVIEDGNDQQNQLQNMALGCYWMPLSHDNLRCASCRRCKWGASWVFAANSGLRFWVRLWWVEGCTLLVSVCELWSNWWSQQGMTMRIIQFAIIQVDPHKACLSPHVMTPWLHVKLGGGSSSHLCWGRRVHAHFRWWHPHSQLLIQLLPVLEETCNMRLEHIRDILELPCLLHSRVQQCFSKLKATCSRVAIAINPFKRSMTMSNIVGRCSLKPHGCVFVGSFFSCDFVLVLTHSLLNL